MFFAFDLFVLIIMKQHNLLYAKYNTEFTDPIT